MYHDEAICAKVYERQEDGSTYGSSGLSHGLLLEDQQSQKPIACLERTCKPHTGFVSSGLDSTGAGVGSMTFVSSTAGTAATIGASEDITEDEMILEVVERTGDEL